jgi:hypothetical protein
VCSFKKNNLIIFFGVFICFFSQASCKDFLSQSFGFVDVGDLCDIQSYVTRFKQMSKEELFSEKRNLDRKEAQKSFANDEVHLVKRWLVEAGLQTNLAQASKEALVNYYFERFHKLSDPLKFHVDHPLVIQSRLVKSYRDL